MSNEIKCPICGCHYSLTGSGANIYCEDCKIWFSSDEFNVEGENLNVTNPPKGGSGVPSPNRKFRAYVEYSIEVKDTLETELISDDEIISSLEVDYSREVESRQFKVTPVFVEVEKGELKPKNQYNPDYATHPGEIIADELPFLPDDKKYEMSNYHRELLLDIIMQIQPVSSVVAQELAALFGTYEEFCCKKIMIRSLNDYKKIQDLVDGLLSEH